MKLFSRTTLVALGTAAAVSISGVSAPAFAETQTFNLAVGSSDMGNAGEPSDGNTSSQTADDDKPGDDKKESEADKILGFIKVITAIIGVVSAILTIIPKLDGLFK